MRRILLVFVMLALLMVPALPAMAQSWDDDDRGNYINNWGDNDRDNNNWWDNDNDNWGHNDRDNNNNWWGNNNTSCSWFPGWWGSWSYWCYSPWWGWWQLL